MIEVEIKVRISNPDIIRKKLEEHNGIYKTSLIHEDTYFNMPKGLRDFKKTDEALRIRKSIEFNKHNKDLDQKINYFITYKGKKIDSLTKSREEIDIKINSLEKMKILLKELGFQEILAVKKERELYEFYFQKYQIEILIDYLPILKQHFMEIEYLSGSENEIGEIRQALFDFLKVFGIDKKESIRKSYLELIADKFENKLKI
ncbi:MAG: class IV adenylate cyclase [Candidatus Hodarchaeota archaeon]